MHNMHAVKPISSVLLIMRTDINSIRIVIELELQNGLSWKEPFKIIQFQQSVEDHIHKKYYFYNKFKSTCCLKTFDYSETNDEIVSEIMVTPAYQYLKTRGKRHTIPMHI